MSAQFQPTPALLGRHAVVTGAGQGIGEAIACALGSEACSLSLMGRRIEPLQALAQQLQARGVRAQALVCDVSDAASVQRAFAQAREGLGPVGVLVNNAGQADTAKLERTSDELWARMLGVNLSGSFHTCREALPDMQSAGWGRIVNVASTAGQKGYAYVSAYCAAKHGVIGLTRALALEVAAHGITVNAVCPGYTDTELLRQSVRRIVEKTGRTEAQALAGFTAPNPQGRLVQPEEVAFAVRMLCLPAAAAINGQSLGVSGGEYM
jgi:NAD(P)-dependent dehydrogenase (short-subunit alcohol dehydrogenase family)